jgi:Domain of unknown function (DUF4349)
MGRVEEPVKKIIPILILMLACTRRGAEVTQSSVAADAAAAPVAEAQRRATPMIVRTAEMRITVADTAKSVEAITKSIEAGGGYVSASNVWREGDLLRARLTLRVPSEKLTETLASIRGAAKRVENEVVTSEDVSQEYVDLEAQLRNLEATEAELRELLTVARVNSKKATDVLEVHQQLTVIRGQIEQAKGRMRYLSQVTSMSSVNLDVLPEVPVVSKGWQPTREVRDASRALIALMQRVATAVIWFVIYVLPVLGMVGLMIGLLVRLARRAKPA